MPSHVVCLRVPLKSYLRIRTARMSPKIVRHALEIREKHEMNKIKENEKNQRDHQLVDRIVKIENTLKTMEEILRGISKKLNQE